jgi:hypothetical protein
LRAQGVLQLVAVAHASFLSPVDFYLLLRSGRSPLDSDRAAIADDPVAQALIADLACPGGNMRGFILSILNPLRVVLELPKLWRTIFDT